MFSSHRMLYKRRKYFTKMWCPKIENGLLLSDECVFVLFVAEDTSKITSVYFSSHRHSIQKHINNKNRIGGPLLNYSNNIGISLDFYLSA